jgi:UDP-glucose 4-epimerase
MQILITGTAGRIGRAIHVRLSPFHDVIGIDKSPASTVDIIGDITNEDVVREACKGVDAIIHTAALHAPHVGIASDAEFERINVAATEHLIHCALAGNIKHIIFTSTTALYGSASRLQGKAAWIDEQIIPQPISIYHRTKLRAEAALERASREHGLRVSILRMSRCFPEAAPEMAWYRLSRGVDALESRNGSRCETYIVSGNTPFLREDCEELWHDAASVLRRRAPDLVQDFMRRSWNLPTSIDRVYDSAKAQRELGWKPRYGYKEVLSMLDAGYSEVLPTKNVSAQ